MPNYTPNYSLKKPLGTENYNVEDQNGNMDIIDAQIKANDDAIISHKTSSVLDHPDGSVTDAKIGNRTIDQDKAPANTGLLTVLLGGIANMIRAITGKPDWKTAPRTTLENAVKLDGDTMKGSLTVDVGGVAVNGSLGSWGTINWRTALKLAPAGIILWPKGTGTRSIGIGKTNDDLLRIMANTTDDNTTTVENLILVDAAKKVTFFNGDVDVSGGVNSQLKVQKSGKDSNGTFTTIEYRRQNNSLFLRCVLSNPDASGNYQTDTWTFYQADGKAAEETRIYTLTYDADGDLVSASY